MSHVYCVKMESESATIIKTRTWLFWTWNA